MAIDSEIEASLLRALNFAAERHRDQCRKGAEASPYINHPIEVAQVIVNKGGVTDPVVVQAAVLHDTLEDTDTASEEPEAEFGAEVEGVVRELTDDKDRPKEERKRIQAEHAGQLSYSAKVVKLSDKISNVRSVAYAPAPDWTDQRRREYLDWAQKVVAGCRGCNADLEAYFGAPGDRQEVGGASPLQ